MSSGGGGSSGMRGSSGGSSGGSWAPPTSSTSSTMTPSQSRWYFSAESLHMTPSRRHNISSEKELSYRQQAANLIQDMGQRLQVPQLCINTAIVYMQRFYMFHSFTRFHRNTIAAASIFLAAKVEEQPRKLEHVIKVAHICIHRDQSPPDPRTEQYMEQAQELVTNENILLQTLGFDVAIDHPHTHVVKCCQLVKASKELAQTSYLMASNSLHLTTMCLRHSPTIVACVCIHLACKWAKYQIPLSSRGKEWFLYVDPNATLDLLNKLTEEFLTIFEKCPSRLKKKIMASTKATKEEEERRALGDISASHYQPDYSRRTEAASTTNPSKHPPSTQPKTGQVPPGRISSNQHPPRPDKPHHSSQQPHHRSSTVPPPGQPAPDKPSKPTDVSRATYDEYKKQKQQQQPPQVPQGQSTQSRSSSQQTHRHISSSSRPPQGQSSSQHLSLIQQPPQRPPSAAPSPLPSQQQLQKHHKHNGPPPQQQSSRHQQPPVAQHGHGWQSKSKPEQHRHHKQPPPQQHTQQQLPRHHAAYPQHSSQQQSKSDRKPNLPPQHPKKSIFDIDESPPLPVQKEPPSILPQASTSLNSNQTTGSNNGLLNLMLDPVVPSHSLIKPDALTVKVSPSKKEKSLSPSKKHRHDKTASLFSPPSSTSSNGTPTPTPSRVRSISNCSHSSNEEISVKLPKVEETPGYEKLRDGRTSIRLPKDGDKSFTKTAELPIDVVTTDEKSEELSGESERKKHKKEKKSKKEKKEKKEKKDKERSKDKSHKHKHKDKDRSKDSSSKHHHSHHQHSSSSIVPITTGSHSSYNSTGDSSVIQKPHGIKLKIKPIPPQNQESAPPPKLDPLKISLKSTTDSKKRQRPSADNRTSSPSSKMARILDSNDGSNDYLKSHDGRSKKT